MRRRRAAATVCGISFSLCVGGCGVVGPPIAPEDVGVNPTIARQKTQLKQSGITEPTAAAPAPDQPVTVEPKGQDEELPPLRPFGTR
ncbi:MAG: hypothetical protein U0412_11785 [Nitrospira sp.]